MFQGDSRRIHTGWQVQKTSSMGSSTANLARTLASTVLALCVLVPPCLAETGQKRNSFGNITDSAPMYRVYTYRQRNGVPAFSDKVPYDQPFEVMEFSCYACNPHSTINWNSTALFTEEFAATIEQAAKLHGIDASLVRAVIHAESGFNPRARSNKGAIGLMQLMPGTASDMGVNPNVAAQNIQGGVKYLALMLKKFDGDITLATAAYNAGPSSVEKFRGIPPFAETQVYVKRVQLLHERYKAQG